MLASKRSNEFFIPKRKEKGSSFDILPTFELRFLCHDYKPYMKSIFEYREKYNKLLFALISEEDFFYQRLNHLYVKLKKRKTLA